MQLKMGRLNLVEFESERRPWPRVELADGSLHLSPSNNIDHMKHKRSQITAEIKRSRDSPNVSGGIWWAVAIRNLRDTLVPYGVYMIMTPLIQLVPESKGCSVLANSEFKLYVCQIET